MSHNLTITSIPARGNRAYITFNIIHLAQLRNMIGAFVPRDRPRKKTILDGSL